MKKLLLFFFPFLSYNSYSQAGIGNSIPTEGLDINRPPTNTFGLVLPVNPSMTKMRNPQGRGITPATMIYIITNNCIRFFRQNAWLDCLLTENANLNAISKVEQKRTFIFNNSTYKENATKTTANIYTI